MSDLSGAVLKAIELDKKVWSSGLMPDNALTTIVLITDGRSAGGNHQVAVSPIFYEQLFRAIVFCAAFMCLQFGFVIFWQKDFAAKAAHKVLVKLTPGGSFIKLGTRHSIHNTSFSS